MSVYDSTQGLRVLVRVHTYLALLIRFIYSFWLFKGGVADYKESDNVQGVATWLRQKTDPWNTFGRVIGRNLMKEQLNRDNKYIAEETQNLRRKWKKWGNLKGIGRLAYFFKRTGKLDEFVLEWKYNEQQQAAAAN